MTVTKENWILIQIMFVTKSPLQIVRHTWAINVWNVDLIPICLLILLVTVVMILQHQLQSAKNMIQLLLVRFVILHMR